MYRLKRENVEKLTDSEEKKDMYMSQGYKIAEEVEEDGEHRKTKKASGNNK